MQGCHIPNSTWIPKVLPSHSQVLLSTLKYSWVSWVKPEPVHLPPYIQVLCIHPSLALSLLRDSRIPALYYFLYTLYTQNWHTVCLSFRASEYISHFVFPAFLYLYWSLSDLRILGSSEAVLPPLSTLIAPEHCPEILFLSHFYSFPFCINTLRLPSRTLVQIST